MLDPFDKIYSLLEKIYCMNVPIQNGMINLFCVIIVNKMAPWILKLIFIEQSVFYVKDKELKIKTT